MKILKINKEQVVETVKESLTELEGFEWNGWGIDILTDEEGNIFSSSKNAGNQVYQSSIPLLRVEAWHFDSDEYADLSDAIHFNCERLMEEFETGEIGSLYDLKEKFEVEFV